MILTINNLTYAYGKKNVLEDISFSADYGEYIFFLGANGVGKSTLFKCSLGHLPGYLGSIQIDHKPLASYSPKALATLISYIPQNYASTFHLSVLETVTLGRASQIGLFSCPSITDYEYSHKTLQKLGIDALSNRSTSEISGGERQLVFLARALVQEAKILILDEPTSNLDYGNSLRIQTQLRQLAKEGMLVLQSSHDPQAALFFADRVIALDQGKILVDGPPQTTITPETLNHLYHYPVRLEDGLIKPHL